jgi:hypothetical protein
LRIGILGIQRVIVKTAEGIYALIYSIVLIALSATEACHYATNAGRSIKEADSFALGMNRRLMVAVGCVGALVIK